ncbi:MAG: methyltransferase domain-containing protein [Candidatus Riflebacteria bacterium]|nr:methyltransferase domain-containing protein [Candidatus Riflebacteria bacterium]
MGKDLTQYSIFSSIARWHVNQFVEQAACTVSAGSRVLDAGAGECDYKRYFTHCGYVAVDLAVGQQSWDFGRLDAIARLSELPLRSDVFEAILCTQTLEHLEFPRESIAELHRVLKPGGKLFVTVPMAQGEHQPPHDFFRYTSYGLRSLLVHAGFIDVDIRPMGGKYTRLAYDLPTLFPLFRRPAACTARELALTPVRLLSHAAVRLAQFVCMHLDRFDTQRLHPLGWCATASKLSGSAYAGSCPPPGRS